MLRLLMQSIRLIDHSQNTSTDTRSLITKTRKKENTKKRVHHPLR
jgi:hypothetical protein